jgi:hypothetical protein
VISCAKVTIPTGENWKAGMPNSTGSALVCGFRYSAQRVDCCSLLWSSAQRCATMLIGNEDGKTSDLTFDPVQMKNIVCIESLSMFYLSKESAGSSQSSLEASNGCVRFRELKAAWRSVASRSNRTRGGRRQIVGEKGCSS